MSSAYLMEEVHISSENREKDGLAFSIQEGDVILDKIFRFQVLPAALNFTKPISREKISKAPFKKSERLLRIVKLGEYSAVVAILHQESYIEYADAVIVIKESEKLVTVNYGEKIHVIAKQQFRDMPGAIVYQFVITDTANPQEQQTKSFCPKCGVQQIKGDKFCRECGAPVAR